MRGSDSGSVSTQSNGLHGWANIGCVEEKAKKGDSWTSLLGQAIKYADFDETRTGLFVIAVKGNEIAFFIFEQDYHSSKGLFLKGKKYDGLLGLYVDKNGVKFLPQFNTYFPQARVYKLYDKNPVYEFSIHTMLRCFSTCREAPHFNGDTLHLRGAEPNILNRVAKIGTTKSTTNSLGLNLTIGAHGKIVATSFS